MLTFDCPSDATYRVPTPLFSEQRRVSDYDLSALWMGQWRTPIAMKLPGPGGVVAIATPDPWLHATLKRIAAHRNLSSGWDGGFAPVPPPEAYPVDSGSPTYSVLSGSNRAATRTPFDGRRSFACAIPEGLL